MSEYKFKVIGISDNDIKEVLKIKDSFNGLKTLAVKLETIHTCIQEVINDAPELKDFKISWDKEKGFITGDNYINFK